MEFSDSLGVIVWINVRVCLPLTFLLIAVCCLVRAAPAPASCYVNLLLSDLTQLIVLIALPQVPDYFWKRLASVHIYACCALASLCFRMTLALERCFFFSCPLSRCVTQTKGLLMVCVSVWLFSFSFGSLLLVLGQGLILLICALLPAPLFIVCLLLTLKSINANISASAEEKDGAIGMLLVLLVNYTVSILPAAIYFIHLGDFNRYHFKVCDIFLTLFLLGPCLDVFLFVFVWKELIKKLQMCLFKCRRDAGEGPDLSRSSV